ncbi:MAG TPA: serine/threonine-protein kinase [Candidatus Xenobia bacterium]
MPPTSQDPGELATGFSIMGRYQIQQRLGQGSFGKVYLAQDMSSKGSLRAVKQLLADPSSMAFKTGEQQALWKQETTTLSKLNHPGLPKIFEWFYLPQGFFIIMEWIEGKLLDDMIKTATKPLGQEEALVWAVEVADMLNYLHSQKPYPIVYGDMKPENIMITPDGHARVIDFGVARFLNPSVKTPQTFTFVSPGFSPPEQYKSPNMTQKNDIYAFGSTMWNMLTKENPEKYNFKFPRLSRTLRGLDPELDRILEQCLQERPEQRYASMKELYQDLDRIYKDLIAKREKQKNNPYWRGG